MSATRRTLIPKVMIPVAALVAIVNIGMVGLIWISARDQDKLALEQSIEYVGDTITVELQQLGQIVKDYSWWTDAFGHLALEVDEDWTHSNVGFHAYNVHGIQMSFVVDGTDQTIYGQCDGERRHLDALSFFSPGLGHLIEQARAASPEEPPVPATGMLSANGDVVIVGVSVVAPKDGAEMIERDERQVVLVFAKRLDPAFLGAVEDRLPISGLALNGGLGDDTFALISAAGLHIAGLTWQPPRPGSEFVRSIWPALAGAVVVILLFTVMVLRHVRLSAVEIETNERRARYLALHDPLTTLPNRELLRDRLAHAIAEVGRRNVMAAVICLDLDRFKEVNDTLGHSAGDLLLQRCAERLRACLRETDTVARTGGDEFAIVQPGLLQPQGAERLCQRLLKTLATPFELDGHEVFAPASLGVALIPTDATTPEVALQKADIALYRAKCEDGPSYRFYERSMDQRLQQRRSLERGLRTALQRGEFELFYQPKIDVNHGDRIVGAEALIRWHHPERGLLHPTEFISIAEETGLILPLGEWVLATACEQTASWQGLRISVNISPLQFHYDDLFLLIRRALSSAKMSPDRLELEITEGVLLKNAEASTRIIDQIKDLGVQIAMDDFGTGYASLSYMQKFQFDKLKIDRSFVAALQQGENTRGIVRAIITLGHSQGMTICAEGVEREDQLAFLRQERCDEAQGYYFGRPVPAGEFGRSHGSMAIIQTG